SHENSVDISIGVATLKARVIFAQRVVVRTNWLVLAISECRGGGAVTLTVRTMTLPAVQLGAECFTVGNTVDGNWRLGRNRDGSASLFFVPARREDFDVGDQVGAHLRAQGIPDGHVGIGDAAPDSVIEIFIGRQSTGRSRTAFESRDSEIA